jgi:hypothetical protein
MIDMKPPRLLLGEQVGDEGIHAKFRIKVIEIKHACQIEIKMITITYLSTA